MSVQFKTTVYYCNILSNVIYFCDAKLSFHHNYSSLQCHMILQKSSSYVESLIQLSIIIIGAKLLIMILIFISVEHYHIFPV